MAGCWARESGPSGGGPKLNSSVAPVRKSSRGHAAPSATDERATPRHGCCSSVARSTCSSCTFPSVSMPTGETQSYSSYIVRRHGPARRALAAALAAVSPVVIMTRCKGTLALANALPGTSRSPSVKGIKLIRRRFIFNQLRQHTTRRAVLARSWFANTTVRPNHTIAPAARDANGQRAPAHARSPAGRALLAR